MARPRDAWIDGQFGTVVSVYDPGWQQGLGVFETIGVFGGADPLPLWGRHLARLAAGADRLGLDRVLPADLRQAALELLERNPGDDVLRLQLSPRSCCLTSRARVSGATTQTLAWSEFRRHEADPLASIKTTSYAFHHLARRAAQAAGAEDAVLLDPADRVLETTTGNLFMQAKLLCTPALQRGLLPGVARQALLDQLRDQSLIVEERDIHRDELAAAALIFTTNAVYGPRPAAFCGTRPAPLPGEVVEAWRRAIGL